MNHNEPRRVALVTAVYPGVEPFLADWYRSVTAQDDGGADLWIACDGLDPARVADACGAEPRAHWVRASPGDTPAQVRQRVLERVVERYDAAVLVDSDDVLHPSRVAAARRRLASNDLSACALRLVDEHGHDLGAELTLPGGMTPDAVLPRANLFGLSNSAYRCAALRACLPIPAAARAVDWFLATRTWLAGGRLDVDTTPRMKYRRHGANMTSVRPPFTADTVRRDTALVVAHLALLAAAPGVHPDPARHAAVTAMADDLDAFARHVVGAEERLAQYVARLAETPTPSLWWAHVAHPALRPMWRDDG